MSDTVIQVFDGLVVQDGHVSLDAFFIDADPTLQPFLSPINPSIGVIYDLTGPMDSGRFILEPTKLIFRTAPVGVPTLGVTSTLYVVDEFDPADYSAVLLPGTRGEVRDNLRVCEVTGDYQAGALTWTAGVDFEYQLGRRYSGGSWIDDRTLNTNWRAYLGRRLRHSHFQGRVAFTLVSDQGGVPNYSASEDATPSHRPRLEVLYWQFHTGFQGYPLDRGRAVHDGRSGLPATAAELVEDGWTPGLYVHPSHWDDEDRSQEAELPDTEGKVFDKVNT